MLRLTAPRAHAANRYSYRKFDLPDQTLGQARAVIAAALQDGEPRTRPGAGGRPGEGLELTP